MPSSRFTADPGPCYTRDKSDGQALRVISRVALSAQQILTDLIPHTHQEMPRLVTLTRAQNTSKSNTATVLTPGVAPSARETILRKMRRWDGVPFGPKLSRFPHIRYESVCTSRGHFALDEGRSHVRGGIWAYQIGLLTSNR